MSDTIKHECGIALIRLLKPLEYYIEKYNTITYGLNKLYLLMEKQRNRGQDGAGIGVVKLDPPMGMQFFNRYISTEKLPIEDIFKNVYATFPQNRKPFENNAAEAAWCKKNIPFIGEVLLAHLRYGTHGKNTKNDCHPFIRENNWITRNLALAGNFNLTNVDELFNNLIELGQHPREQSDTVTVMEKIGHFLDTEVQILFDQYHSQGYENREITDFIANDLNVARVLQRSAKDFDGGYVMAGMFGHGDSFVLRDPNGIRPAYYYYDEEIAVVASERPAIQTAFNAHYDSVKELQAGSAIIIKKNGKVNVTQVLPPREKRSCSFERIYFSRGSDFNIYKERKELGRLLAAPVLKAVNYDFENTVFSFIPNTSEVAFYGLVKGVEDYLNQWRIEQIKASPNMPFDKLSKLLSLRPRVEKVAVKDVKMRTFITDDANRDEMVRHVYDITYGSVVPHTDTLVVIDDSIVRGTTLEKSILSILDRLSPKKIIVLSSAPQIRYPDCYGIDMSRMNEFVAFRALVALLEEDGKTDLLDEVFKLCKRDENKPLHEIENHVKLLYKQYTVDEINDKISELVKPKNIFADVQIIFQSIENLHKACPDNLGDWYFTGNYPTPGGNRVVNRSFMNYKEGKNCRAY